MTATVILNPVIIATNKLPDILPGPIRMSHPCYTQLHLSIIFLGARTPVVQNLLNIISVITRWKLSVRVVAERHLGFGIRGPLILQPLTLQHLLTCGSTVGLYQISAPPHPP